MATSLSIGIDIGTSMSRIGLWRDNHVEMAPDEEGNFEMPSVIAYGETRNILGEGAKYDSQVAPDHVLYDIKRFLGQQVKDNFILQYGHNWPFNMQIDQFGSINFILKGALVEKQITPTVYMQQLLETLLCRLDCLLAKSGLSRSNVDSVVMTVPPQFTESQRQEIREAASNCNLKVNRLMSDTSAIAVAHTYQFALKQRSDSWRLHQPMEEADYNLLIFDCGGGSCKASVLSVNAGIIQVKGSAAESYLGGEDFDNCMVNWCVSKFVEMYGHTPLGEGPQMGWQTEQKRAIMRLRLACERAKKILSSNLEARIRIPEFLPGIDFDVTLTRHEFETCVSSELERCVSPIQLALDSAELIASDIHYVFISGGLAHIPKIRSLVANIFTKSDCTLGTASHAICCPDSTWNVNYSVVIGATIQAALMNLPRGVETETTAIPLDSVPIESRVVSNYVVREPESEGPMDLSPLLETPHGLASVVLGSLLLIEITPTSYGICVMGALMMPIIQRNTTIPCRRSVSLTTVESVSEMKIGVYEGEHHIASMNNLLGCVVVPNMHGKAEFHLEVVFEIDANEILTVHAVDLTTTARFTMPIITRMAIQTARISMSSIEDHRMEIPDEFQSGKYTPGEEKAGYPSQQEHAKMMGISETLPSCSESRSKPILKGVSERVKSGDIILMEHKHMSLDDINAMMTSRLRSAMEHLSLQYVKQGLKNPEVQAEPRPLPTQSSADSMRAVNDDSCGSTEECYRKRKLV